MKIDLEVVRGIIRLKLKNYENTWSTSGVISILLKITNGDLRWKRLLGSPPIGVVSRKMFANPCFLLDFDAVFFWQTQNSINYKRLKFGNIWNINKVAAMIQRALTFFSLHTLVEPYFILSIERKKTEV